MCPVSQRKDATLEVRPLELVSSVAVALKCDLLVFNTEQKLPWIVPVSIDRSNLVSDPIRLSYPTGNRKTPAVKIDYRGSGKRICLVEYWSHAARTTPFDKRWRSTETEIGKRKGLVWFSVGNRALVNKTQRPSLKRG